MKKMFAFAATLFIALAAMGQAPVITFDKTTHDFGKINEADGRVTTTFTLKNEGMTPLVLSNVRASCGCTTPTWTHEPIEPGQTGEITVTYNPNGRPGRFQKTVTVTSNATEPSAKLYIKGEVIPKPATEKTYAVKMGDLSLSRKTINYGSLVQGTPKTLEIEYANQTDKEITVEILMSENDSYIIPNVTLKTVAPKQTGKLQFALQTDQCPLLGPVTAKAYVVVNGKREISSTYEITLSANIKEDFSRLTVEERQQAPIVNVVRDIDLGTIAKGKKVSTKLAVSNVGINPLIIRRVVVTDSNVRVSEPKAAIKAGRKLELKLDVEANMDAAQYARVITLITNDPQTPVINIKVSWTVE